MKLKNLLPALMLSTLPKNRGMKYVIKFVKTEDKIYMDIMYCSKQSMECYEFYMNTFKYRKFSILEWIDIVDIEKLRGYMFLGWEFKKL